MTTTEKIELFLIAFVLFLLVFQPFSWKPKGNDPLDFWEPGIINIQDDNFNRCYGIDCRGE